MSLRLDYKTAAPEGVRGLFAPHAYVTAQVPRPLLDLVWLRVSQINGCAYCIDLHSREAIEHGAAQRKVHNVAGWWESPLFDARERAALAYAEAVTRLTDQRVSDAAYDAAAAQFGPKEMADLTIAIALMNAMNRMAISFRQGPPA
jgi:AhpD family alkylhydroperoxidase